MLNPFVTSLPQILGCTRSHVNSYLNSATPPASVVNPIEQVWQYLKKRLRWQRPCNLDALRVLIRVRLLELTPAIVASIIGRRSILDAISVAGIEGIGIVPLLRNKKQGQGSKSPPCHVFMLWAIVKWERSPKD
ncbi:MAG: hypothetical protein IGR76_05250 [Synechococcales cyanobacterium T60_A2020_003]|nr:hypothetical protein [Synechococcales cyanobacterium T60_A2020_003]